MQYMHDVKHQDGVYKPLAKSSILDESQLLLFQYDVFPLIRAGPQKSTTPVTFRLRQTPTYNKCLPLISTAPLTVS